MILPLNVQGEKEAFRETKEEAEALEYSCISVALLNWSGVF